MANIQEQRREVFKEVYGVSIFRDEKELLENINEELKNGNVLLYSKSRRQAELIQNYLTENKIKTLLVT